MTSAVVFAYHNVGARCLRVLLAHGIRIPLVVTHPDDPHENSWFEGVADVAASYDISTIAPSDPNVGSVVAQARALAPDFLFSFYYRQMLSPALVSVPPRGALNMHGSLLPRYRGRAPVNWAVLNGETETGVTLHYMAEKPDAGDIVAQTAVPILPDDTAREVLDKVTVAAELTLDRILPALLAGTAPRRPMDLGTGTYFSGRAPEDGHIDWSMPATAIHNLVRAVAPPYPGARTAIDGLPARVLKTRVLTPHGPPGPPSLRADSAQYVAHCGGGGELLVQSLEVEGTIIAPSEFARRFGGSVALSNMVGEGMGPTKPRRS